MDKDPILGDVVAGLDVPHGGHDALLVLTLERPLLLRGGREPAGNTGQFCAETNNCLRKNIFYCRFGFVDDGYK